MMRRGGYVPQHRRLRNGNEREGIWECEYVTAVTEREKRTSLDVYCADFEDLQRAFCLRYIMDIDLISVVVPIDMIW